MLKKEKATNISMKDEVLKPLKEHVTHRLYKE
jgi:hypothetical protein